MSPGHGTKGNPVPVSRPPGHRSSMRTRAPASVLRYIAGYGRPRRRHEGGPVMNTSQGDQRHFSRIPFVSRVRLAGPQGQSETQLLDISLKGALVARPPGWNTPPGELLTLELVLGDDDPLRIRMHVQVSHGDSERVGLHCAHIDLDSITHLRRLVAFNLGDPALLDRELAAMG